MSLRPSDQPVVYTRAIERVLIAFVLLGLIELDEIQLGGIVLAVGAILDVFVWSNVTPNNRVEAKVDAATKAGRDGAVAYIGSLPAKPARTRKAAAKPKA